jgi:hypothetical protein
MSILDASPLPLEPACTSLWTRSRPSRVAFLLGLIWLLSLADLGFTLWAHRFTPFVEGNPLAATFLASGMTASVILLKLTTTLFATHLFWRVRRYARTEMALWLIILGLLILTLAWKQYTLAAIDEPHWVESTLTQME